MKLTDPNQSFTLHQQIEQVKSSFTTLHRLEWRIKSLAKHILVINYFRKKDLA